MCAACDHREIATNDNIKRAFAYFDKDKNGGVSVEEFKFHLPTSETETSTVKDKMVNDSI